MAQADCNNELSEVQDVVLDDLDHGPRLGPQKEAGYGTTVLAILLHGFAVGDLSIQIQVALIQSTLEVFARNAIAVF